MKGRRKEGLTEAERRYSEERRLTFWCFNFTSSLRRNNQVPLFNPGEATRQSNLGSSDGKF